MSPLSRARKAAPQAPTTLRKQAHGYPHTDSRTGMFPIARKSAHTGASQRVLLPLFFYPAVVSVLIFLQTIHPVSNSTGAQNSQSSLIPSPFHYPNAAEILYSSTCFDYVTPLFNCWCSRVPPWNQTYCHWFFSARTQA